MLLSGLPPLVREGDRYRRDVHRAQHDGNVPMTGRSRRRQLAAAQALAARRSALDASGRRGARRGVATSRRRSAPRRLPWEVARDDASGTAQRHAAKCRRHVIPAYPVRTYQATLAQLTAPFAIPAERPAGALPAAAASK